MTNDMVCPHITTSVCIIEYEKIPCKVVGMIPVGTEDGALNLGAHIPSAEQRAMSLASAYSIVAASEALNQARWQPQDEAQQCATGEAAVLVMLKFVIIIFHFACR